MTKSELLNELVRRTDLPKKAADEFLTALSESIVDALQNEQELMIPGIGKIKLVKRAERMGRNPITGEAVAISARKSAKLVVAKQLKDVLNNAINW